MGRRQKKKNNLKTKRQQQNKSFSTNETTSKAELTSENIIRLKLTTRKGTRIESVPLKKLEKLATMKYLYWKLEDDWLILYGS